MTACPMLPKTAYRRGVEIANSMHYMGSVLTVLAKGQETQGRFAILEVTGRAGNEPPPHYHEWEDEVFYILEGEIGFYVGDKTFTARPGQLVFLPQGKPHAFHVLTPVMRVLNMVHATGNHPVEHDRYFIEMAQPADSLQLPPNGVYPARAIQVAAAHGIIILSPRQARQALPQYPGFGFPPLSQTALPAC